MHGAELSGVEGVVERRVGDLGEHPGRALVLESEHLRRLEGALPVTLTLVDRVTRE